MWGVDAITVQALYVMRRPMTIRLFAISHLEGWVLYSTLSNLISESINGT